MANRRFEMYQYRQVLVRMRMGESNRAIADSGVAGRNKIKAIKRIAQKQGWLDRDKTLPDDNVIATVFGEKPPNPTKTSSVVPYADKVDKWRRRHSRHHYPPSASR